MTLCFFVYVVVHFCAEVMRLYHSQLLHSGRSPQAGTPVEVSEIWLAGMEPTDYLLKMTGGAKSDSDDAK